MHIEDRYKTPATNAAQVLVDGAWRDCLWLYPALRLNSGQVRAFEGEPEHEIACVTAAMIGGVPLLEGTGHRYFVASGGMLYTVAVYMTFEGGNNLCNVLSVMANDAYEVPDSQTRRAVVPDFWCFRH